MISETMSAPGGGPVAVIGSGFAGMTAALHLAEAGERAIVFEAGRLLGGRARSFSDPSSKETLDWGPHLFMAANPSLRDFLSRIGADSLLRFDLSFRLSYLLSDRTLPGGSRTARLAFPRAGGALGQFMGLLRWRGPGLLSRLRIARGIFEILSPREGGEGTVADMLVRNGQDEDALRWFWEPFARAVLNLPLELGSARIFRNVLIEAFSEGPAGATLGVSTVPLGDLWVDNAAKRIRSLGGEIRTSRPVRRIETENGRVRGLVLDHGEILAVRAVVTAVPPPALLALLPDSISCEEPLRRIGRFRPGPIVSAYVWLNHAAPGPIIEALLGEPWHWVFRPPDEAGKKSGRLVLLAGGEDSVAALGREPQKEAARETVSRIFPERRVERLLVIGEKAATWANGVDEQAWRPGPVCPVKGLFLAGDWTATGLPATVEGAVRSGARAAGSLLAARGAGGGTSPSWRVMPV